MGASLLGGDSSAGAAPAPTPLSVDVTEEDRRLRAADRPLTVAMAVGVAGFGGVGVLLLLAARATGMGDLAFGSLLPFGFGALFAYPTYRTLSAAYVGLEVGPDGITVTRRGGRRWRARWDDPALRVLVIDYSNDPSGRNRRRSRIPCQLLCLQLEVGVPRAAVTELLAWARHRRVPIREDRTDPVARVWQVGDGPETGLPFQRV